MRSGVDARLRCQHHARMKPAPRRTSPASKGRKNSFMSGRSASKVSAMASDKLVTVDVKPGSPNYGKVINRLRSMDGTKRTTADSPMTGASSGSPASRAARFSSSTCTRIRPSRRYVKTIDNFGKQLAARSARMAPMPCPAACSFRASRTRKIKAAAPRSSNTATTAITSPRTGCRRRDDARGAAGAEFADGYGYDARVLPRKNALLTSSFTGWNNYMRTSRNLTGRRRR